MLQHNFFAVGAALLVGIAAQQAVADEAGLLRTSYALDEPRGYCIDIWGFGQTVRLEDPLQVHSCKYGEPLGDQVFARAEGSSAIEAVNYDRCLAAAALEAGAELFAAACEASPLQQWSFEWGRLSPQSRPDLCVSLDAGNGVITGTVALVTPVYRRRPISLQPCDAAAQARQVLRWSATDERGFSGADELRLGLGDDVEAKLAAFGHAFSGPIARQTNEILAPIPTIYEAAEIDVTEGLAYGPHSLQQLDIHSETVRRADWALPSVVMFHGGGLVGGDKASTVAAANYFASIGFIGVNANYRLAPEHPWPAGGRDVGAAVSWLHENIAEYGGDPQQIFVLGLSSGSLHAADYVFRSELMAPGTVRAVGAILMSGPYTFDFANPSAGTLAYYGENASAWPERVVIGNVSSTDIPVLFTTAEWDAPRYTRAFAQLLEELVMEHGVMPRYKQSLGHNHSSQLQTMGTAERSVSAELVDFIQRTVGR